MKRERDRKGVGPEWGRSNVEGTNFEGWEAGVHFEDVFFIFSPCRTTTTQTGGGRGTDFWIQEQVFWGQKRTQNVVIDQEIARQAKR